MGWWSEKIFCSFPENDEIPLKEPFGDNKIKSTIVHQNTRFAEKFEFRRAFVHPDYQPPKMYNDIAIVELGQTRAHFFIKPAFGSLNDCKLFSIDKIGDSIILLSAPKANR